MERMTMKAAPDASPKLLIDSIEASRRLSISSRTLYRLTKAGQVPAVRMGRAVRYSPADLAAWVESQKAGACIL
jgi:excisionase family DNA binding protein